MPSVIIMGGSIAGLTSGLMLARAGHQVTVVDRDAAAVPQDVEEAAGWIRPTVLVMLGCRRTTLEWVLRALAQPGLTLRRGVQVTGLAWRSGPIPQVIGVTTREHGGILADVVLDASGRHTELRRWACEKGVALDEWDEDCGLAVYTRSSTAFATRG